MSEYWVLWNKLFGAMQSPPCHDVSVEYDRQNFCKIYQQESLGEKFEVNCVMIKMKHLI